MKHLTKTICAIAIVAATSGAMIETASALPAAAPASTSPAPLVQDIGWRCGPGWHVNPWGRCVPNRGPRHPAWRRPYYRRW